MWVSGSIIHVIVDDPVGRVDEHAFNRPDDARLDPSRICSVSGASDTDHSQHDPSDFECHLHPFTDGLLSSAGAQAVTDGMNLGNHAGQSVVQLEIAPMAVCQDDCVN